MKILFFCKIFDKSASGPFVSQLNIMEALETRGHYVGNLCKKGSKYKWKNNSSDLNYFYSIKDILNPFSLIKFIKKFDLISFEGVWFSFGLIVSIIAINLKIPYVINVHGNFNPTALFKSKLKKKLFQFFGFWYLKNASGFRALTKKEKSYINTIIPGSNIYIVPNSLNLSKTDNLQKNSYDSYYLFLGRIDPIKGLELLIESWSVANLKNYDLVIAGDGDKKYINEIKNLIKKLNLNNIKLIGQVNNLDKNSILKNAHYLILSSHSEAFPMVLIESLNQGTPILVSKNCNMSELRSSGGFFEFDHDVRSLSTLIKQTARKQEKNIDKKRLYNFVFENYSNDRVSKLLVNEYLNILNKKNLTL